MTNKRHSRRFRSFVASQKGHKFELEEFSLWLKARWEDFAAHLDIEWGEGQRELCRKPAQAIRMRLGGGAGDDAFDEWLDLQYGVSSHGEACIAFSRF